MPDIIELDITEDQLSRAKKLYDFKRLRRSFREGAGNLIGATGEVVVYDYCSKHIDNCAFTSELDGEISYDYDIVIDGRKMEVKTKTHHRFPEQYYDVTVEAASKHQKNDHYIFAGVLKDFSKAYILGWIPRDEFYEKAQFYVKGQSLKRGILELKNDCYILQIKDLHPIKKR